MKKMKLFPKIFLFTFTMMLLISIIAHLLIFLIAPSPNVLVTNMVVTNTGVSALSEVDMPRLITQTMLKTFPISILCCAAIGTFRIDAELIFPVRAIKAAGAAVLRRDRLAAVVVVKTGLALHELFKGPIAAGSEVHRPSPPFCFWAKRKAADFFQNLRLGRGTEKGAVMLDNTLFLSDYSVVLTCPVFRCPKKH